MKSESTGTHEAWRRVLFVNDRPVPQGRLRSSVLDGHGLVSPLVATILVIGMLYLAACFVFMSGFMSDSETANARPPTLASYDFSH